MVMRVDESGGDDFAVAIDHCRASWHVDILADLRYQISYNEDVGILKGSHVIGIVVVEDGLCRLGGL